MLLTPYPPPFLHGAAVDLPPTGGHLDLLDHAVRRHIDTISTYGLDWWAPARRRDLIDAVVARRMQLVPRIEAYDPDTFAFRALDADNVVDLHGDDYLRDLARAHRHIPYVHVNMPVDDPQVTDRLGGRGPTWSAAQCGYAATIVRRLRPYLGTIPIYLSVFYGWDGAYDTPSYAGAAADGYVLTSYPYPGRNVAGPDSTDDELIDGARLRRIADRLVGQYPGAPTVVEYGLHTMTGRSTRPDQTAGLVLDRASKQRALRAITRLYRTEYPQVRGTIYFGLNITKREGDPPADIDWSLL